MQRGETSHAVTGVSSELGRSADKLGHWGGRERGRGKGEGLQVRNCGA